MKENGFWEENGSLVFLLALIFTIIIALISIYLIQKRDKKEIAYSVMKFIWIGLGSLGVFIALLGFIRYYTILLDTVYSGILVFIIGCSYSFFIFFVFPKHKQLLSYIPSFWTVLGILGTFAALLLGLAPDNIPKEEGSNQIAIISLIGNLTSAFSTSIVGIVGAVVTSIIVKIRLKNIYDEESQIEAQEAKEKWQSMPEKWQSMHFEEILYKNYKILEEVKNILGDADNAPTNKLSKSLKDIKETQQKGIDALYEMLSKNSEQLKTILGDSKDKTSIIEQLSKLNDANNEPTKKLASSIDSMSIALEGVGTSINNLMTDFKDKLDSFIKTIERNTNEAILRLNEEAINKAKEEAEKANKKFQEGITHILESNTKLSEYILTQSKEQITKQGEFSEKIISETTQAYTNSLDTLNSKAETTSNEFQGLIKGSLDNTSKTLEDTERHLKEVQSGITTMINTQKNEFITQVGEMNSNFTTVMKSMETALGDLSKNMLAQTQAQLDAQLTLLQESIGKNIKSLNDTIQFADNVQNNASVALQTTTEEFAEAIRQYGEAKSENKDILAEVQEQIKVIKELRESQEANTDTTAKVVDKIAIFDEKITDIENTINQLAKINDILNKISTQLPK